MFATLSKKATTAPESAHPVSLFDLFVLKVAATKLLITARDPESQSKVATSLQRVVECLSRAKAYGGLLHAARARTLQTSALVNEATVCP